MDTGRSSSVYSAYSSVQSIPRTSPSELTISVTTRPHPPLRFTRRRNAVSVMPAIGASANGGARLTLPIFMRSIFLHVGRVHLDAHRLSDEIDGEHQSCVRALAGQPSDHTFQRAVGHLDHGPLANQ